MHLAVAAASVANKKPGLAAGLWHDVRCGGLLRDAQVGQGGADLREGRDDLVCRSQQEELGRIARAILQQGRSEERRVGKECRL